MRHDLLRQRRSASGRLVRRHHWIVLAFIPTIPLGSMRVLPVSQAHLPWYKRSGQPCPSIKVPLHMSHLWKGWAVTFGLFLLFSVAGKL